MVLMPPIRRRKGVSPFDRAALGTYRGPARLTDAPKATPYRVTLLRAIAAGEVKAGQGQYTNAWRWHGTASVTCTKWVREFIGCGWVKVVGSHVELTDEGRKTIEEAT